MLGGPQSHQTVQEPHTENYELGATSIPAWHVPGITVLNHVMPACSVTDSYTRVQDLFNVFI